MRMRWPGWAALLMMANTAAWPATMPDPARYVWKARVLLVFAPGEGDANLVAQLQAVAAQEPGMKDRDLVLLTSLGAGDQALRHRYGVEGSGFAALLIGKDGGVKLRSAQPISPEQLFQTVDAMPMRRSEIQRRPP